MHVYSFFVGLFEIFLIALVVYYLIIFFWNTRAFDLMIGALVFLVLYWMASWFRFPVLQKLMLYIVNVSALALLVIFQPEVRLALSKLNFKNRRQEVISDFDRFLEGLVHTVYKLSEKRVGALLALENQDNLEEFARKGILLNARFSPELLESIFMTTTPLHDGGVILRGSEILSASVIFPLAEEMAVAQAMGTRHRAGIGISQISDALVIVVSEESGKVSIAREGLMTRSVKPDRFKAVIRNLFMQNEAPSASFSWTMLWDNWMQSLQNKVKNIPWISQRFNSFF